MNSQEIFSKACELMPGGVNSPVRAYRAVGMTPPFIERAEESHIFDVDGNKYVDYVGSWGPMILGHAREEVVRAVTTAAVRGTSFGAPTNGEVELAELIRTAVPSMEMMRMVNSGTEAVMSAIRAARGYTGRDYIVKFEGCYHGHSDGLLVKAGSGLLTENVPDSAGVPKAFTDTKQYGAVLIFDEVITGFRLALGGAQSYYGVTPDMTTFGKIVGGGMPMAVYGGRREIMDCVSPAGPVYQAGTLSGNPVAVAAGTAMLKLLMDDTAVYDRLEEKSARIENAFRKAVEKYHIKAQVNRVGSLMSIFFTDRPVKSFDDVQTSDLAQFAKYFRVMKAYSMYIAPSQYEAFFVNDALSEVDFQMTERAIDAALSKLFDA